MCLLTFSIGLASYRKLASLWIIRYCMIVLPSNSFPVPVHVALATELNAAEVLLISPADQHAVRRVLEDVLHCYCSQEAISQSTASGFIVDSIKKWSKSFKKGSMSAKSLIILTNDVNLFNATKRDIDAGISALCSTIETLAKEIPKCFRVTLLCVAASVGSSVSVSYRELLFNRASEAFSSLGNIIHISVLENSPIYFKSELKLCLSSMLTVRSLTISLPEVNHMTASIVADAIGCDVRSQDLLMKFPSIINFNSAFRTTRSGINPLHVKGINFVLGPSKLNNLNPDR
jgi:hypothetical protein